MTRHRQGFTVIHPTPAFPSPVTPDGTGSSGFSLSFAHRRAGPGNARQGGDRPGHCLDYAPGIGQPPSTYSLTTCDLTSHDHPDLYARRSTWARSRGRADRRKCAPRYEWATTSCGRSGLHAQDPGRLLGPRGRVVTPIWTGRWPDSSGWVSTLAAAPPTLVLSLGFNLDSGYIST